MKYDTLADFLDAVADSAEQEDKLASGALVKAREESAAHGCLCALGAHAYRTIPMFKELVDDIRAGKADQSDDRFEHNSEVYDILKMMLPGIEEVPKEFFPVRYIGKHHVDLVYSVNDDAPDRNDIVIDKAAVVAKLRELAQKARENHFDRIAPDAVAV